jgi:hypothetical protein
VSFLRQIFDHIENEDRVFIIDPLDTKEREKIFSSIEMMSGIGIPQEVF